MKRFLAGDIGGTKVIMALYQVDGDRLKELVSKQYVSKDHASFTEIIEDFRKEHPDPVDATGLGVAGPVFDRRCQATNLPWVIDARELESKMPIGRVALVNDFKAAALGVLHLQPGEWVDLNVAKPVANGPIAVAAVLRSMRETAAMTEEEGLARELELGWPVYASDDAKEGPRAFKEKRPPNFTGT